MAGVLIFSLDGSCGAGWVESAIFSTLVTLRINYFSARSRFSASSILCTVYLVTALGCLLVLLCTLCAPALYSWDGSYQVVQQQPIGKFPKWTGILGSVQEELAKKADINAPFAGGWSEFVQKTQSADKLEMRSEGRG